MISPYCIQGRLDLVARILSLNFDVTPDINGPISRRPRGGVVLGTGLGVSESKTFVSAVAWVSQIGSLCIGRGREGREPNNVHCGHRGMTAIVLLRL